MLLRSRTRYYPNVLIVASVLAAVWLTLRPEAGHAETTSFQLNLKPGYSLIHIPFDPGQAVSAGGIQVGSPLTAGKLYGVINQIEPGCIESVETWDKSRKYTGLGDTDFNMELGRGYFVRCSKAAGIAVSGAIIGHSIQLLEGWNCIGIPDQGQTASSLAEHLGGACEEVKAWYYGNWKAYAPALENEDFPLENTSGYLIKVSETCTMKVPLWTVLDELRTVRFREGVSSVSAADVARAGIFEAQSVQFNGQDLLQELLGTMEQDFHSEELTIEPSEDPNAAVLIYRYDRYVFNYNPGNGKVVLTIASNGTQGYSGTTTVYFNAAGKVERVVYVSSDGKKNEWIYMYDMYEMSIISYIYDGHPYYSEYTVQTYQYDSAGRKKSYDCMLSVSTYPGSSVFKIKDRYAVAFKYDGRNRISERTWRAYLNYGLSYSWKVSEQVKFDPATGTGTCIQSTYGAETAAGADNGPLSRIEASGEGAANGFVYDCQTKSGKFTAGGIAYQVNGLGSFAPTANKAFALYCSIAKLFTGVVTPQDVLVTAVKETGEIVQTQVTAAGKNYIVWCNTVSGEVQIGIRISNISSNTVLGPGVTYVVPSGESAIVSGAQVTVSGELLIESGARLDLLNSATMDVPGALTVQAGARLRFSRQSGINVSGRLTAAGSADSRAIFTSAEESPSSGAWRGIVLYEGSNAEISYCDLALADIAVSSRTKQMRISNCRITGCNTGIYVYSGAVKSPNAVIIDNNTFQENYNYHVQADYSTGNIQITNNTLPGHPDNSQSCGVVLTCSALTIEGNTFLAADMDSNPATYDNYVGILIHGIGGDINIRNNTISGYTRGILVDQACNREDINEISGNTITGNQYGLKLHYCLARINGNYIHGNTVNLLASYHSGTIAAQGNYWGSTDPGVIAGTIQDYSDEDSSDPNVPAVAYVPFLDSRGNPVAGNYLQTGEINQNVTLGSGIYLLAGVMQINSGATLTIPAGARIISYAGSRIIVKGGVSLQGTSSNPITFTSARTKPAKDDWLGLELTAESTGTISYCNISYAACGIAAYRKNVSITNCRITDCSTGICIRSGDVTAPNAVIAESNTLLDNYDCHILVKNSTGNIRIRNNTLGGNSGNWGGYGIKLSYSALTIEGNGLRADDRDPKPATYEGSSGIYVYDIAGEINIRNNTITGYNYGLFVEYAYSRKDINEISGNTITGNRQGVRMFGCNARMTGNRIHDNSEYNLRTGSFTGTIRAENNYWGSTDPGVIAQSIRDHFEESDAPIVDYVPFWNDQGKAVAGNYLATGEIGTNMTLSSGRYLLAGEMMIDAGATLTIPAGTTIASYPESRIIIKGGISAQGTEKSLPITLTSAKAEPARGDWHGLELIAGSTGNLSYCSISYATCGIASYRDNVTLSNCRFTGCTVGISVNSGEVTAPKSVVLNNNVLQDNYECHIKMNCSTGNIQITNNTMGGNHDNPGGQGICALESAFTVEGNKLQAYESGSGIYIRYIAGDISIRNNIISGYGTGIQVEHASKRDDIKEITGNAITGNTVGLNLNSCLARMTGNYMHSNKDRN
ncbi:MAG: right-handed parallel beta-helix repeat-containing protein, partial [Pseudomonadota bacterium]